MHNHDKARHVCPRGATARKFSRTNPVDLEISYAEEPPKFKFLHARYPPEKRPGRCVTWADDPKALGNKPVDTLLTDTVDHSSMDMLNRAMMEEMGASDESTLDRTVTEYTNSHTTGAYSVLERLVAEYINSLIPGDRHSSAPPHTEPSTERDRVGPDPLEDVEHRGAIQSADIRVDANI